MDFRMDFLICEEPNEPRDFTVIPKDKETNYLLSKLYSIINLSLYFNFADKYNTNKVSYSHILTTSKNKLFSSTKV